MGRGERIAFGTLTGAVLGLAVVVLHLCFARNWVKESVFSSFFFILAGFGLGGFAWNWVTINGEWSDGPFLNDVAANRTLLLTLGGIVVGSVLGGLWSSRREG
jgi:protein-S-isoprenylcysteine O-methyltransferase Ste14